MSKLLQAIIHSIWTLVVLESSSLAGPKVSDDEDTSLYMLSMAGAETVSSTSTIRVKIFPHEKDYLPHGRDKVLDQFTVRSENPCTVFKSKEDQIVPVGTLATHQNIMNLSVKDLHGPVIIDCPESFTLERESESARQELTYSGLLYVHAVKKQDRWMLEAINVLSLRGYLRGVVPSEVYHHWPMETLKTQAVAARTYAVYHIIHARRYVPNRLWDVDDTVMFQAYTGMTHRRESTDSAVFATEGQILMWRGQVIQAFYHADSGGSTEEASTVWQQAAPFTVSRSEATDLEMNSIQWERTVNLKELTSKLQEMGEWPADRQVVRVVVPMAGQTFTGRVKSLTLMDQKGSFVMIPNRTFKRAIGGLPSNLYSVDFGSEAGQLLVKGVGNGHGVGMSQQGAAALADQKSWSYRQILEYYYVRTTICTIDSGRDGLPECARESFKYSKQVASQPVGF